MCAIWLCELGNPDAALQAQPVQQEKLVPAQAYHRIFVPAGNVDAWPRNGEKYLPIETREFEALIAAANGSARSTGAGATIVEARYSVRLEGDRLVAGRGQWTIEMHDDGPVLLPLGDMSLILREPRWKEDRPLPDRAKSHQQALLGIWGASGDAPDQWGLEVERSGVLEFDWHSPSAVAPDGLAFEWRMPAAHVTRLALDLPEGKLPVVAGGAVVESRRLAAADGANTDVRWRWEIALEASNATVLRIVDAGGAASDVSSGFVLREDLAYQVTERGLEFETVLEFEELLPQLREIAVPLPPNVQLMSVNSLNQELPWHVVSSESSPDASAVLALPAASSHEPLRIKLRAWQSLLIGQEWRLPKLRPTGALWSAGRMKLVVAPTLVLQRLKSTGSKQTGVLQSVENGGHYETQSFAAYSADAALEIVVAPSAPNVTAQVVSSLALAETDVNGSLNARLHVSGGNLHRLSGEVAPGWNIESVEMEPSDALGEWFVERKDDGSEVEIQLAPAAGFEDKLTVIATGRLQGTGLTQALPTDTLRMIRWRNVRVDEHLLSFQTVEPYVVEPIGGLPLYVPQRPGADALGAREGSEVAGVRFDLTAPPDEAALRVAVKRGQYEADIWVDATYVNDELRQEFHIVARPKASHIDRLLVYATQPLGDSVHWIERQSGTTLVAERISADSRRQSVPPHGETWLVRLPHPTGKPVEIVASLNSPWSGRKELPLISVPEAIDQRGRVLVRGNPQLRPLIEANAMPAIPSPLESEPQRTLNGPRPILCAYRYQPADCLSLSEPPVLWLEPAGFAGLYPIIARRVEIESFFMLDGRAVHRLDYHLEHEGLRRLLIRLPAGSRLVSLSLGDQVIEVPAENRLAEPISVALRRETNASVLTAHFETHGPQLRSGGQLQPPLLDTKVPLLTGHWTVWLPAEFSALGEGAISLELRPNVRQRLFGPLGRPRDTDTLNLFRPTARSGAAARVDTIAAASSHVPVQVDGTTAALAGWRAHTFSFVAQRPADVRVTRPASTVSWSIAIFLICAASGRWVWRRRREAFVGLLAASASLALLLPAMFSPLATGAFMGLLCSLLVLRPARPLIEESPTKTWSRPATVAARIVLFVVINVAALLCGAVALGQYNGGANKAHDTEAISDERQSDDAAVHRVLIPMDANGRAAGTKTYVSERFLRELHARAPAAHRQWILLGADYQGELRDRTDSDEVAVGDWTMTFLIEVLARDTTIVLPLVHDEAIWDATAMLDGIPTPLIWGEGGRGCMVHIAEPGQHELVIPFIPRFTEAFGRNQIELTVPPLAGATARLQHPGGLVGVNLSGTAVEQIDGARGELVGELDGLGRITVDWPRVSANDESAAGPRVTALQWLRIGVDEAELDTKFIVEGGGRQPQTVTLKADKRWELQQRNLPAEVSSESDGSQTIRVSLPANEADGHVVSLRWRLAEAPALGRFRPPHVELTSLPVTQRWLAISSASALKFEVVDGEGASPGTANEFMTMWGTGLGVIPPEVVLADVEAAPNLALAIEPRAAKTAIDGLLHAAAHSDGLRVQYKATVIPGGNDQYQLALEVSENVTIDDVVLSQSGRQIASRWARDANGILTVFFSRQLPEPYEITVTGRVPIALDGTSGVPQFNLVGRAEIARLQLYGSDDVQVELTGASEKTASGASVLEPPPAGWTAVAAGAFELRPDSIESARIHVEPNRVDAIGHTHTVLSREADGWWAAFGCRLKVEQGKMGSLQLSAPSTWKGPIAIESNVGASLEMHALDEQNTMLSVRFAEPLEPGQELDLELRGRVATDSASPPAVPEIDLLAGLRGPRFVSVPTLLDSQPIAWSESGVKRAELPRDLPPPKGGSNWATYEVMTSPFQIALRPVVVEQPHATVRLVDTFVKAGPLGNRLVYTRMVVVSQNLPECILELPRDQELLRVTADGRPAGVRPQGESQWRLTLGPAKLPQFIEILSRSASDGATGARRIELRRPQLLIADAPIPVEMSLWSYRDVVTLSDAMMSGADRVDRAQQAASRLDRLVSISESATPTALEASFPDGYNWYYPWAARLVELRREMSQATARSEGAIATSQVMSATENEMAQASDRLDAWLETCDATLVWSDLDPSPPAYSPRSFVPDPPMEFAGGQWIHGVAEGGDPVLSIELRSIPTAGQARAAALAMVAGTAAGSVWLLRRPAAWDALCRWPHALGFLLGIAYWAALWPSWLGIVIAAASLLLALRSDWPGRSMRSEGSTVLRLPPR
ncbi:MAG TPA: hypothetical protein VGK58_21600 [Lacipirellulaceae bacterium]